MNGNQNIFYWHSSSDYLWIPYILHISMWTDSPGSLQIYNIHYIIRYPVISTFTLSMQALNRVSYKILHLHSISSLLFLFMITLLSFLNTNPIFYFPLSVCFYSSSSFVFFISSNTLSNSLTRSLSSLNSNYQCYYHTVSTFHRNL